MITRKKTSRTSASSILLLALCMQSTSPTKHSILRSTKHPLVLSYQLKVSSQTKKDRGAAPCALEALFNGHTIVQALTNGDAKVLDMLSDNDTTDRTRRITYWKHLVGIYRTKTCIRTKLTNELKGLLKHVKKTDPELSKRTVKRKWLSEKLSLFATELVDDSYETGDGSLRYRFTGDAIKKSIQGLLEKYRNDKKLKTAATDIITDEEFDSYFAIRPTTTITLEEPIQDGEWLSSGEIDIVVEGTNLTKELNSSIFHTGGTIQPTTPLSKDAMLVDKADFKDFCARYQSPTGSCCGLFIVYATATTTLETSNENAHEQENAYSFGHWYCIVANKVGTLRQYIVADSLDNAPKLNDTRLNELIELIEGDAYSTTTIEKKTPLVSLPIQHLKASKEIVRKKSLTHKVRAFLLKHRALVGISATIASLFAYRKFAQYQESSLFRKHKESFDAQETSPNLFRSLHLGKLHGAHRVP